MVVKQGANFESSSPPSQNNAREAMRWRRTAETEEVGPVGAGANKTSTMGGRPLQYRDRRESAVAEPKGSGSGDLAIVGGHPRRRRRIWGFGYHGRSSPKKSLAGLVGSRNLGFGGGGKERRRGVAVAEQSSQEVIPEGEGGSGCGIGG